jgi:hypothetical protein
MLLIIIIGGILVLYIYIYIYIYDKTTSNEIFSSSNKINREVGRAKEVAVSRPRFSELRSPI